MQLPPELKVDQNRTRPLDPDIQIRHNLEKRVVWNMMLILAAAGFNPVCVESDDYTPTTTPLEVI